MIPVEMLRAAVGATDDSRDDWLLSEMESALAFLQRETHRYFGPLQDRTDYLRPTREGWLWLTQDPASTDIMVVKRVAWSPDGDEVDAEDYEVRGRQIILHTGARGGSEYEVWYPVGYGAPDYEGAGGLPADIRKAVLMLIKAASDIASTNAAKDAETIGGYSYSTSTGGSVVDVAVPPFVQRTIQNWRRGRAP